MKIHYYVIAGNANEYNEWVNTIGGNASVLKPSERTHVKSIDSLRGKQIGQWDTILLLGSWYLRDDIKEIMTEVRAQAPNKGIFAG